VPLIPLEDIKAASAKISTSAQPEEPKAPEHLCPCCGSNMRIIETFLRGQQPKHKPTPIPPEIKDRYLMMTELMLDTCKYAQCLCWLPADNVIPCIVTSMLPFGKTQKRKIALQRRSVPVQNSIHAHAAWQNCLRCRHAPPHRRLSPRRNPHSCGTTAVPNPRFPALALFGRRPSECVERPSSRQPKTYTTAEIAVAAYSIKSLVPRDETARHSGSPALRRPSIYN
jgi:hypothetical protein